MKVNFDTSDYFNVKTLVWGLLLLAALIITYHAGVMHGECRAQKHIKHMMQMRAMHGGSMPMKDVMFMRGEAAMMPGIRVMGSESGSIQMHGAMPDEASRGMRVMKIQHGEEGQAVFLYKNQ